MFVGVICKECVGNLEGSGIIWGWGVGRNWSDGMFILMRVSGGRGYYLMIVGSDCCGYYVFFYLVFVFLIWFWFCWYVFSI